MADDRNSIIMGDFNSHHSFWNCSSTDTNGERLLHAIESRDLFLHNTNPLTHVDSYRNQKSNLDLILSTMNISDKIRLSTHDETWGSDHYPIYINISTRKNYYHKKTFKISSIRTDWEKVFSHLKDSYAEFFSPQYNLVAVNEKYRIFTNKVTEAIRNFTPKRKIVQHSSHRNPVPWWDNECNRIKRLRRAAFKKWEYTKELDDLIHYKKW